MHALPLFLLLLASGDDDAVWRAIDAGDAAALRNRDAAEIVRVIRKGRPVERGRTGEFSERIADAFGRETDLFVVVPPAYDRARPAGLLVVLHGLGGTGSDMTHAYRNFAAANGFIVACPTAQPEPEGAPNEDAPKGDLAKNIPHWWSYREGGFVFAALALLKRRYAIDENRVILSGYSMGGFGTWNIGLRYPDRFAAIVPMAGGLSRLEYFRKSDERLRPLVRNAHSLPVCFVHGNADMTVPVLFDRRTRDQLKELGYDFEYREVPKGGHMLDVREGKEIMNAVEAWMKPKKRNAHPRAVKHYFVGDYGPQAYWVRVTKFADASAQVDAKIEGQTIDFAATGAGEVTFYLDETLLDLSKSVKVTSGGKTLFEGKVKPSSDVVIETWKAREDRELVFRAKIAIEIK